MRYACYGLTIEADLDLGLPPGHGRPDVEVRRVGRLDAPGTSSRFLRGPDGTPVPWTVAIEEETVRLWFADGGTFGVDVERRRIDVAPTGDPERVAKYVLATAVPVAAASLRLTLHAGAVVGTRGALAVVGASGRGKSTSVAGLARRGWPALHDDRVLLSDDLTTYPGPPWEGATTTAAPAPLAALVVLDERGGADGLRPLTPVAASAALACEGLWWQILTPTGRRARFDGLTAVAERGPCFRWSAPEGLAQAGDALAELAEALIGPGPPA